MRAPRRDAASAATSPTAAVVSEAEHQPEGVQIPDCIASGGGTEAVAAGSAKQQQQQQQQSEKGEALSTK